MPVKFNITSRKTGRQHKDFGGLISESFREVTTLVRGVVSRNLWIVTQLMADLWVDIVQKTTWDHPVPSPRNMIIAEPNVSTSSVRYGWDDYNSGDPAKRLEERRSVYMSALGRMFDNYSFLTRSERSAGEANKAYRAAMDEVVIYPRPTKLS